MSLDQLARAAAAELHRGSGAGADTDGLLHALRRTRTRRTRTRAVVAGFAVVGLGIAGGLALGPGEGGESLPVAPVPSPSTLPSIPSTSNGQIVVREDLYLRAFDPVTGERATRQTLRTPSTALTAERAGFGGLAWSPDGRTIYDTDGSVIYAFDTATGTESFLVPCVGCGVSASPDGRTLAVTEGGTLRLVDLGTRAARDLITPRGGDQLMMPAWSRDGGRIAFVRTEDDTDATHPDRRRSVLETVRSDGTERRELMDAADADAWALWSPSWSADDSTVAVLALPEGSRREALRVFTVGSAGGPSQELTTVGACFCIGLAPGLAWSPDGAQLAAVVDRGLVVVAAQPRARPRLLVPGVWGIPAWQPLP